MARFLAPSTFVQVVETFVFIPKNCYHLLELRRLLLFLTRSMDSTPTLLGLPGPLRKRILRLTGLRQSLPIMLYGDSSLYHRTFLHHFDRHNVAIPTALLRTCKQLSQEAADVLYGENCAIAYCDGHTEDHPLLHLRADTAARIRDLQIHLGPIGRSVYGSPIWLAPQAPKTFPNAERQFRLIYDQLDILDPFQINLSIFVIGCTIRRTALPKSLESLPLLTNFKLTFEEPHLQKFQINSKAFKYTDSQEYTWQFSSKLTPSSSCTTSESFHGFPRLPAELRSIIIHHATLDLATPHNSIQSLRPNFCTPGRSCVDLGLYVNTTYNWRTSHIFFRGQSGRCERCLCHLRCCGSQKGKPKALLCRCPPRKSYSPSCTCPAPPLASNLLFVSQEFREESSTTKFGNSEFLVTGNTCEV